MATSLSFTLIEGPKVLGPAEKVARYKVQMPSAWVEAGHAVDLSAEFAYVNDYEFATSGAVTDYGYKFDFIGTYTSKGIAAASLTLVGHIGAAGVLPTIGANTDVSAVNDMICTVRGS
jgi:hypothetical protein